MKILKKIRKRARPEREIVAKNFSNKKIIEKKIYILRVTDYKFGRKVVELSLNRENFQDFYW